MEIIKTIGGKTYKFNCSYRAGRGCFYHDVILSDSTGMISAYKIKYLNRTWEAWTYKTACRGSVRVLLDRARLQVLNEYRQTTGFKRLSQDRKRAVLACSGRVQNLEKLYNSLF